MFCIYFALSSILYSILCLNPHIRKENDTNTNLFYFKDIAESFENHDEFFTSIEKLINNKSKLQFQISEQIFQNSKIANNKYKNVKKAVYMFGFVILCLSFTIFIILFNGGIT